MIRLRAIRSPAASVKKIAKKSKKCTTGSRPAARKNQKNEGLFNTTVVDDFTTACFYLIENQIYKHVPCKSDICKLLWIPIDNLFMGKKDLL